MYQQTCAQICHICWPKAAWSSTSHFSWKNLKWLFASFSSTRVFLSRPAKQPTNIGLLPHVTWSFSKVIETLEVQRSSSPSKIWPSKKKCENSLRSFSRKKILWSFLHHIDSLDSRRLLQMVLTNYPVVHDHRLSIKSAVELPFFGPRARHELDTLSLPRTQVRDKSGKHISKSRLKLCLSQRDFNVRHICEVFGDQF